jgi:hypothetical protein
MRISRSKTGAKFKDLSSWLFSFSSKVRNLVAVGISAVVWTLWNTRNAVCFEHVYPSNPVVVLHKVAGLINKWTRLQRPNARLAHLSVARLLVKVVSEIFNRSKGWSPLSHRIGVG